MKTKSAILVFLAAPVLFPGCAHTPKPSSARAGLPSYEESFDPWRASHRALQPASRGDQDAQLAFFLSAYVRMSQPSMGGEDLEQMRNNAGQLLTALGDDAFSGALQQQRPEVRSAVRSFLDMKNVKGAYPKTFKLLDAAPKIDWPTEKAYRNSEARVASPNTPTNSLPAALLVSGQQAASS